MPVYRISFLDEHWRKDRGQITDCPDDAAAIVAAAEATRPGCHAEVWAGARYVGIATGKAENDGPHG